MRYRHWSFLLSLVTAGIEAFKTPSRPGGLNLHSPTSDIHASRWMHGYHQHLIHASKDDFGLAEAQDRGISGFLSDDLTPWQARLLLGAIACAYGTNTIAIKVLENNLEPSMLVFFRFVVATIIFLPFIRRDIQESSGDLVRYGMYIGLVNAIGFLAQSAALLSAAASNTAFTASLSVVVVPLIEILTPSGRKNLSFAKFYPAFLAIAGVACLELGGESSSPSTGDVLALIQPIAWGWSYVLIEKFLKDCKKPEDSLALTGGMVFAVVLVAFAWCFLQVVLPNLEAGTLASELSRILALLQEPQVISSLVWTGIFTTGLASLGECVALRSLTASEATIIFTSEPIWASIFASIVLGESFGLNSYIGGGLVIAATIWSQKIAEENDVKIGEKGNRV